MPGTVRRSTWKRRPWPSIVASFRSAMEPMLIRANIVSTTPIRSISLLLPPYRQSPIGRPLAAANSAAEAAAASSLAARSMEVVVPPASHRRAKC